MTRKLLQNVLLCLFLLLLWSCRADSELIAEKQTTDKFAAFKQTSETSRINNDAQSFNYLYNRYYELRDIAVSKKNSKNTEAYIDFDFYSQKFVYDNGDRMTIFPLVKNTRVIGLIAGILEKEETYLRYAYLPEDYESYDDIIKAFQEALNKKQNNTNTSSLISCSLKSIYRFDY